MMKEELKIEDVAMYLPYNVKYVITGSGTIKTLEPFDISTVINSGDKLAVKPLSDTEIRLVKYNFHTLGIDGLYEWQVILQLLRDQYFGLLPQCLFIVLLVEHVDVANLIGRGLAVNLNDLKL